MLILSLIVIGGVILTNFISFSNIEKTIIEQVKENQFTKTKHAANQIESHVLQVKDELVTLSKFPVIGELNSENCEDDITDIHEKITGKISSLLRVNKNGDVIECSSQQYSSYIGLNIKNKDYFTKPKETYEPYIAGIIKQGENQQIIVSAPLFETTEYTPYPNFRGEFKGVLLSIVELNDFYNLYIHQTIQSNKNLFLLVNLNTKETILKSNGIKEYKEIEEFLPVVKRGYDGIYDMGKWEDTIITSSDLIFNTQKWRLIVFTPLKGIEEDIGSVQSRHLFSLGFVIIVIVIMFAFLVSLYKSKEEMQLKLDKASVTLEKLGINVETEKEKFSQADINLETGKVYLIKEDDENNAHELFIGSLNRGFAGLGIVREDPRELKKRYNLQKTSFIWLTNNEIKGVPCETKIKNLYGLITEFIDKSERSVILIDRLDYVISENEFDEVVKKIHLLKDLALSKECIVIISANPELVSEDKLKVIAADTIDLYGKHLKNKIELADNEMEMLKLINEKNIVNKLVSYKDITENFKITKPTTRVKINKLQGLGLLQVDQRGRFKSLKITSAGRKIINGQ